MADDRVPRCTYDPDADAAYIRLAAEIGPGESVRQIPVPAGGPPVVVLDLDADGRLLGVEVLGARAHLRPELLRDADPPDSRFLPSWPVIGG